MSKADLHITRRSRAQRVSRYDQGPRKNQQHWNDQDCAIATALHSISCPGAKKMKPSQGNNLAHRVPAEFPVLNDISQHSLY